MGVTEAGPCSEETLGSLGRDEAKDASFHKGSWQLQANRPIFICDKGKRYCQLPGESATITGAVFCYNGHMGFHKGRRNIIYLEL